MSSQSNQSRDSLNRLSNYILKEQNIDIRNYTIGHLNESHLNKTEAEKCHKTWKTSLPPNKKKMLKKSSKNILRDSSKPYSSMSDINELLGELKETENDKKTHSSYTTESSDQLIIENLTKSGRLPNGLIKLPRINSEKKRPETEEERENINTLESESQLNNKFYPVTDKEMAMCFLNGPFKGASKAEKFNNLNKFEKIVIQKENLVQMNPLHSIESVNWLEKKLQSALVKLEMSATNDHKFQINIYRLDIFNNIFEQIIIDSKLFGAILNKVKLEYDEYLFYLLRNQQLLKMNHKYLRENLIGQQEKNAHKIEKIKQKTDQIDYVEKMLGKISKANINIEQNIIDEETFQFEKENEFKVASQVSKSTYTKSQRTTYQSKIGESTTSTYLESEMRIDLNDSMPKRELVSENLEATKFQILEKITKLEGFNEELKKDYVPMVVINNLNQSIKDTEMEINKITDQNKFLISRAEEQENHLKKLLMVNDNTEFSDENTDLLLKMIRNFGMFISNDSIDSIKYDEKSIKKMQMKSLHSSAQSASPKDLDENIFYDDYFS